MARFRPASYTHATLFLLVLALLTPISSSIQRAPAGNGDGLTSVEKSDQNLSKASELPVLETAPEVKSDASEEAKLDDCFEDDSEKSCGFYQRMLKSDYAPPTQNNNPHPGGPLGR